MILGAWSDGLNQSVTPTQCGPCTCVAILDIDSESNSGVVAVWRWGRRVVCMEGNDRRGLAPGCDDLVPGLQHSLPSKSCDTPVLYMIIQNGERPHQFSAFEFEQLWEFLDIWWTKWFFEWFALPKLLECVVHVSRVVRRGLSLVEHRCRSSMWWTFAVEFDRLWTQFDSKWRILYCCSNLIVGWRADLGIFSHYTT